MEVGSELLTFCCFWPSVIFSSAGEFIPCLQRDLYGLAVLTEPHLGFSYLNHTFFWALGSYAKNIIQWRIWEQSLMKMYLKSNIKMQLISQFIHFLKMTSNGKEKTKWECRYKKGQKAEHLLSLLSYLKRPLERECSRMIFSIMAGHLCFISFHFQFFSFCNGLRAFDYGIGSHQS